VIHVGKGPDLLAHHAARFDVVCAGEALWALGPGHQVRGRAAPRPSGGAVNAALELVRRGLRVGLAAGVADDAAGRALVARVAAAGVDTRGVVLAPAGPSLVLVEPAGNAARVVPYHVEDDPPVVVPEGWTAPVLLISGLSPALPRAASLCRAARAARRAGAMVVVDLNARRHAWAGGDPRAVRAVVQEACVVRGSTEDLAALGAGAAAIRAAMRPGAILILTDGAGSARAIGPFGEIARAPPVVRPRAAPGVGDAFTAALCMELLRAGDPGADRASWWDGALREAHAVAQARMAPVRGARS
jgi:sugar/nucleoside kinase (ribokinase family)